MKFKIQKKIGDITIMFEDDAENDLDFFARVSFYANLPSSCVCGSLQIVPDYRETKEGYKFAEIKCLACKKVLQFGQHRNKVGSLFKKQWVQVQEGQRE